MAFLQKRLMWWVAQLTANNKYVQLCACMGYVKIKQQMRCKLLDIICDLIHFLLFHVF